MHAEEQIHSLRDPILRIRAAKNQGFRRWIHDASSTQTHDEAGLQKYT